MDKLSGYTLLLALVLVIGAIIQVTPLAAQSYRWIDQDGKVHYGDKPPEGAATREIQGECNTPECIADRDAARQRADEQTRELQAQQAKRDEQRAEERQRLAEIEAMQPQTTIQREVIVVPVHRRYYSDHPGRPVRPVHPVNPGRPNRPVTYPVR